jgi:hypothetical protein
MDRCRDTGHPPVAAATTRTRQKLRDGLIGGNGAIVLSWNPCACQDLAPAKKRGRACTIRNPLVPSAGRSFRRLLPGYSTYMTPTAEHSPDGYEDNLRDEVPENVDTKLVYHPDECAEDAQRPLPGGGINRSGSPVDQGPVHRWHAES